MKKCLSIVLALILALGLCVPAQAAESTASFVVTRPGQLPKQGESFTVTVELTGGVYFSAVQFTLRYNNQEMTCTDIVTGDMFLRALAASNPDNKGGASVAVASSSPIQGEGVLATLYFTATADVTNFGFTLEDTILTGEEGVDLPFNSFGVEMVSSEIPVTPSTPDDPSTPVVPETPEDASDSGKQPTGEETIPTDPTGPSPDDNQQPSNSEDSGRPVDPVEREPSEDIPTVQPDDFPVDTDTEDIATLFPDEAPSFPDTIGHWGETFVSRAASLGLFKGYADGLFRPDEKVTRAQFVTVLWRLAQTPAPAGTVPFTDTASLSQEFQNAIAWGYEHQYVNGKSAASFDPNGVLTRQEAMTILFRYSGSVSGMEAMLTGTYDAQYIDSGEVAEWAKAAMYWGIYSELISGTGENTLSPRMDATRVQLAKIMVQYIDQF